MLFQDSNETPVRPRPCAARRAALLQFPQTSIYGAATKFRETIVSKMVLGL